MVEVTFCLNFAQPVQKLKKNENNPKVLEISFDKVSI